MSLLRQRAIEVSVESTLRERRPADARAWFVRLTSCDSEAELKLLASHASVVAGTARMPTDVAANATTSIAAKRRGARSAVRDSRSEVGTESIDGLVSCGCPEGGPVLFRP